MLTERILINVLQSYGCQSVCAKADVSDIMCDIARGKNSFNFYHFDPSKLDSPLYPEQPGSTYKDVPTDQTIDCIYGSPSIMNFLLRNGNQYVVSITLDSIKLESRNFAIETIIDDII